jgi:hypothetical protein
MSIEQILAVIRGVASLAARYEVNGEPTPFGRGFSVACGEIEWRMREHVGATVAQPGPTHAEMISAMESIKTDPALLAAISASAGATAAHPGPQATIAAIHCRLQHGGALTEATRLALTEACETAVPELKALRTKGTGGAA